MTRYLNCSICSRLAPSQSATYYVLNPEQNIEFPEPVLNAIRQLKKAKELSFNSDLMQCPECNTYYLYKSTYEYLVGGSGSYDEYTLSRLDDETGKKYSCD